MPHIFYATEQDKTTIQAEHGGRVTTAFVTAYQPRWFFLPRISGVREFCESTIGTVLSVESMNIFNSQYDSLELFTDIPSQADIVLDYLRNKGLAIASSTVTDYITAADYKPNALRAYFFGAPLSSALRARPDHFMQIDLPDLGDGQRFRTHIILFQPKRPTPHGDKWQELISELGGQLEIYHRELFRIARGDPEALLGTWWAYNRYADVLQHNSSFKNVRLFADCLECHHRYSGEDGSVTQCTAELQ